MENNTFWDENYKIRFLSWFVCLGLKLILCEELCPVVPFSWVFTCEQCWGEGQRWEASAGSEPWQSFGSADAIQIQLDGFHMTLQTPMLGSAEENQLGFFRFPEGNGTNWVKNAVSPLSEDSGTSIMLSHRSVRTVALSLHVVASAQPNPANPTGHLQLMETLTGLVPRVNGQGFPI